MQWYSYGSIGKNKMRKFFVANENILENEIKIVGSDVNHIKNVLRLKKGDTLQICDQETHQNYYCEICEVQKYEIQTRIIEKMRSVAESNVELHIYQGLPKADKMELIIQKGTELRRFAVCTSYFSKKYSQTNGKRCSQENTEVAKNC